MTDIAKLYEELRSIIDGGSESFTHEDAVQYLKDKLAQPEQEIIPLSIEDGYVRDYLWDRALVAIDDPCDRSHPHENMGAYCKHRTELARIQAREVDKNDEIYVAYGFPKETPPQRTWVELSEEQKRQLNESLNLQGRFPIIDAIEAMCKGNNT